MVIFKWLNLTFGILGGLISLVIFWKGRNYFRVYQAPPERGIFPCLLAIL